MERTENMHERTYIKFDTLLAITIAYASIVYNIFSMINRLIHYKKLNLELINQFFHFTDKYESTFKIKLYI